MAFILKVARLIPLAVRLSLAGGAAYGTAKVGVWSDSSGSQDKLKKVRESWLLNREIEYPTVSQQPYRSAASELSVSQSTLSSVTSSAATSWNWAIKSIFQSAVKRANMSSEGFSDKLTQQLKKWTDK